MPKTNKFWYRAVMVFAGLAYVSLAIGGYQHRSELNIAAYSIWLVLSSMLAYSAKKQNHPSFYMVMTWAVGNAFLVLFSLVVGGYTYNLDAVGTIGLYGIALTIFVWGVFAAVTGKSNNRVLFWGAIGADMASFYPQLKQYYLPHEQATVWLYVGWMLWIIASNLQLFCVDKLVGSWKTERGKRLLLIERSMPALENSILLVVTTLMMAIW